MNSISITESASHYNDLEKMDIEEMLISINNEDLIIAKSIRSIIPKMSQLITQVAERFIGAGRLFYIGAGTSGRLGILDASEIPPTYGLSPDRVVGIIAGGDQAIRNSVENAEDSFSCAKQDLEVYHLNQKDTVIGIAASGTTPYVIGGIRYAKSLGCLTACITNNPQTPLSDESEYALEAIVGPEFVTGSTRMKSGTAQKMILNMISTSLMIKIGRVKGNKMINMQLNNQKLINRGIHFLMQELKIDRETATKLLDKYRSVKKSIYKYHENNF